MELEKELDDNSIDEEVKEDVSYCEKQLDIEGLSRAYEKLCTTNIDGFFKDVLCLAISSLCG